MKVRRRTALIFAILFLLLYTYSSQSTEVTDQSAYSNQPTQAIPAQESLELFTVTEVIDGDTIRTNSGEEELTIRLIGIDTPETKDPNTPVQCFGEEAGNHLQELLADETFYLEPDLTQADKDRYGRLLRYLILEDGTNINLEMIRDGYAYEYTYQNPYKFQVEFQNAEQSAKESAKGLWATDNCNGQRVLPTEVPIPTPTFTPIPTKSTTNQAVPFVQKNKSNPPTAQECMYSCSSPDRDCSDFSSHSEAQIFFECCGFSATNDPMKLDGLGVDDGIACESI